MVDAQEAAESNFITAELIEDSPTKRLVVVSGGSYEEGQFGRRLQIKVNIDKKEKRWNPNRTTVQSCIAAWGKDTDEWIGKTIEASVKEENGRKNINGVPLETPSGKLQ